MTEKQTWIAAHSGYEAEVLIACAISKSEARGKMVEENYGMDVTGEIRPLDEVLNEETDVVKLA